MTSSGLLSRSTTLTASPLASGTITCCEGGMPYRQLAPTSPPVPVYHLCGSISRHNPPLTVWLLRKWNENSKILSRIWKTSKLQSVPSPLPISACATVKGPQCESNHITHNITFFFLRVPHHMGTTITRYHKGIM